MKVISQIASYFWQQGLLSQEVAMYLVESGFVPQHLLPGFERATTVEPPDEPGFWTEVVRDTEPLELVEESLVQSGRRGSRGRRPVRTAVSVEVVRKRIRQVLSQRREVLQQVLPKCFADVRVETWQEAASRLRNEPLEKCTSLLEAGLRARRIGFNQIWEAVEMRAFEELLDEKEEHGRTARAWQRLLDNSDPMTWGADAWLLRFDEVQEVNNIRWIHEGLLKALHNLFVRERHTLLNCLNRHTAPVVMWSLVILYSAFRHAAGTQVRGLDYGPVGCPDGELWNRALQVALKMNCGAVGALILHCGRTAAAESEHFRATVAMNLYCPSGFRVPRFSESPPAKESK